MASAGRNPAELNRPGGAAVGLLGGQSGSFLLEYKARN